MKQPQTPTTTDHITLSHKEAKASSPKDMAIAGEEDPGAALEDLVEPHFGEPDSTSTDKTKKR